MTAIVERVAIAHREAVIRGSDGDTGKSGSWESIPESWREHHRDLARAVLLALREPSEEMFLAANGVTLCESREGIRKIWQAMIAEAQGSFAGSDAHGDSKEG